jgi:hypothetical protein
MILATAENPHREFHGGQAGILAQLVYDVVA